MIAIKPLTGTDRLEMNSPRHTMDGVYFTRFDTFETEDEWIFRSPMPEVELIEVETKTKDGQLAIQGKVRLAKETSAESLKPLCFYRSFPNLGAVVGDRITATFKNGALMLCLPKAKACASKT
jgi:HSP20 family molecular chaperone IbpA